MALSTGDLSTVCSYSSLHHFSSEKRHLPEDSNQLSICFESPSDVNDPVAEELKTAEKSAQSETGYNRFRKSFTKKITPHARKPIDPSCIHSFGFTLFSLQHPISEKNIAAACTASCDPEKSTFFLFSVRGLMDRSTGLLSIQNRASFTYPDSCSNRVYI